MPKIAFGLALAGLLVGLALAAAAQDTDATDAPASAHHHPSAHWPAGPNAKRYCRSWLVKEYRVSGPVIVPRMQCWWQ